MARPRSSRVPLPETTVSAGFEAANGLEGVRFPGPTGISHAEAVFARILLAEIRGTLQEDNSEARTPLNH